MLSERGYFWWSDSPIPAENFAPDDAVAGTLTISDAGRIKIKLHGILPSPQGVWSVMDQGAISPDKRIAGLLHKGNRHVLALDLHRRGGSFQTNGFSSESFIALYCLISESRLPKNLRIASVDFDLAGYEEWMRLGRFEKKRTARSLTLKHKAKRDLVYRSETRAARLQRRLHLNERGMFGSEGIDLVERARLHLRLSSSMDVSGAALLSYSVQDLLILLTNSEYLMPLPAVKLASGPAAQLYFGRSEKAPLRSEARDHVVSFPQIEAIFGDILFKWLGLREELGAGAYLYLATRRGMDIYAEHRFLNLVTGLEAFHRKWNGSAKRFELQERLIDLLGSVPIPMEQEDLEHFLKSCAKVRNDIAHRGRSEDADASGQPINWLESRSAVVAYLYHARLLLEIGVPEPLVERWLKTNSLASTYMKLAGLKLKESEHPALFDPIALSPRDALP